MGWSLSISPYLCCFMTCVVNKYITKPIFIYIHSFSASFDYKKINKMCFWYNLVCMCYCLINRSDIKNIAIYGYIFPVHGCKMWCTTSPLISPLFVFTVLVIKNIWSIKCKIFTRQKIMALNREKVGRSNWINYIYICIYKSIYITQKCWLLYFALYQPIHASHI